MPYSTTDPALNLRQLGRDARHFRNGSEQFCAFAFDLEVLVRVEPPVAQRSDSDYSSTYVHVRKVSIA